MAKKTTTTENLETGVSVKGQFTLEGVPDLLAQVNEQIRKLKGDKERAAKITESLGVFGRVCDIKEPGKLIDAYAFITRKAKAYEEFAPVFQEIDTLTPLKSFTESGHSLKSWQEEILAQYRETTFESKLAKLMKAKDLLTENLSREQKFAAAVKDIADLFSQQNYLPKRALLIQGSINLGLYFYFTLMLEKNQLIEGNIYKTEPFPKKKFTGQKYIFKYTRGIHTPHIELIAKTFSDEGSCVNTNFIHFETTTFEEQLWLEACEKAGQFIPQPKIEYYEIY